MDTTDKTVTEDKLLSGYTALKADGTSVTGTFTGSAVTVTEEQDSHGGTIKHISSVVISDTTATAADVVHGKYFYTADGTKTQGTASDGEHWVRPATWPDLESINTTGFHGVYLTYDLSKVADDTLRYISIASRGNGYKQTTVQRGHIDSNNEFVADYTATTSSYVFTEQLDPENGNIQLWRVTDGVGYAETFRFEDFNGIQNARYAQPCVEMMVVSKEGQHIDLNSCSNSNMVSVVVRGSYNGGMYAFTDSNYSLERLSFEGASGTITDARGFTNLCYHLFDLNFGDDIIIDMTNTGVQMTVSGYFVKKIIAPHYIVKAANPVLVSQAFMAEEIDLNNLDVSAVTSTNNSLLQQINAVRVLKMDQLDFSSCTTFGKIEARTCSDFYPPKIYVSHTYDMRQLSVESILRIFNSLPSVQSAQTVTIGAINLAKVTAEQIAIATAKGWTVA